jgi:hypothetical protein
MGSAQVLPLHKTFKISGGISAAGEQDYYTLTAKSGQTITARAGFSRTVQILDSTGAVLATSFGGTANHTAPAFPLGMTRTYYVVVSGGLVGNYTLTTTVN